MAKEYELLIIGAGPGGLAAGLYAGRSNLKTAIVAAELGGQIIKAHLVENYPGLPDVSGEKLVKTIKKQAEKFKVEFIWSMIEKVEKKGNKFILSTTDKKQYQSKALILSFGKTPQQLGVQGEDGLIGKGVGYCATCDMPFFKDKTVAVVGGGNSAIHAVLSAETIVKKTYLIHRRDQFRAEKALLDKIHQLKEQGKVEVLTFSEVKEIIGKDKVEKIIVENNKTKKTKEVKLDGVFIEIGFQVKTSLVKDLVELDERNEIVTNIKSETKTPGLFVAGDISADAHDQAVIAAGQGANAAISAYQYLKGAQGEPI